ncbi:MAG: hypothetical protein NZO58_01110 [Gemmataceae bacterium]|nr:hypothetical protein [Gemmataceae bacterium]
MRWAADVAIVKVGGSLFDLADLRRRLLDWLDSLTVSRVLLIPGGGTAADVVRAWDRRFQLGEETSHWLALRMLQVNAHLLAHLLPGAVVLSRLEQLPPEPRPFLAVLDALAFAQGDEADPNHVPHRWEATSDSIALRVAQVLGAGVLYLLKSVAWDNGDWEAAARRGVVDPFFPDLVRRGSALSIHVVNLRAWRAS